MSPRERNTRGVPAGSEPAAARVMVVAGEHSGDKHAAKLISALHEQMPGIEVVAAGGEKMRQAGATLLHDLVGLAVIGTVEIVRNYRRLRKVFYEIVHYCERAQPDAVVLVDYPGFNIRLAKEIKRRKIPTKVIFYISPQVWAWGMGRKKLISRVVDRLVVIFPFEKDFYEDLPVRVDFVGHPMCDDLKVEMPQEDFRKRYGIDLGSPLVALLPGSRRNEVRRLVPVMLESARIIRERLPGVRFALQEQAPRFRDYTQKCLQNARVPVTIVRSSLYDLVNAADIALVASGTATLETACLLTPMVIVYKVTWFTYCVGRMLITLPYIGLANVVAGEMVAPEFIQHRARPAKIAAAVLELLTDAAFYGERVDQLEEVRRLVGTPGASRRAAEVVVDELRSQEGKKIE